MDIVILCHARDRGVPIERFAAGQYARFWREAGHRVRVEFGPQARAEGDVVLVHVNRSVVPRRYLEYARRFPLALNAHVADVRKTAYSTLRLERTDAWEGPVIVKTVRNFAGQPERRAGRVLRYRAARRAERAWRRLRGEPVIDDQSQYPVFRHPREVPPAWWSDPRLVVERFLPERHGEFTVVRNALFVGTRHVGRVLMARGPVVTSQNVERAENGEIPPEIHEVRRRMRLDYGKIDFVVVDGRPVVIDVNKTIGSGDTSDAETIERRRYLAEGVLEWARGGGDPAS